MGATSPDVWGPDDPRWGGDGDVRLIAGAAFGRERFALAASVAGESDYEFDNYCRFLRHAHGQWTMSEVDDRIVAMLPWRDSTWSSLGIVVMSWEGQVVFLGDTIRGETIAAAGIMRDGARGYVNGLRAQGGELWACGDRGSIYRRRSNGIWEADDEGAYRPVPLSEFDLFKVSALALAGDGTCYAGGLRDLSNGVLFARRPDDGKWRTVETGEGAILFSALATGEDEVVLGGHGLVMVGSVAKGFRRLPFAPGISSSADVTGLVRFAGATYLAAGGQVCIIDGNVVRPVSTHDRATAPAEWLQVLDQDLWAFGSRGVARYDGAAWDYFVPPLMGN